MRELYVVEGKDLVEEFAVVAKRVWMRRTNSYFSKSSGLQTHMPNLPRTLY